MLLLLYESISSGTQDVTKKFVDATELTAHAVIEKYNSIINLYHYTFCNLFRFFNEAIKIAIEFGNILKK